MDFQFIHSVAKGAYVDLPSAKPVPNVYLTELRKYAGAGDGIDTEPGSCYSYLTIKPGNEAAAAFLSYIERKRNARYPCNYIQSAGWIARDDMLLNDFDAILAQDFFTEDQVDGFVDNSQVPPIIDHGHHKLPSVKIHREAMSAVLYGCFRRWQMSSAPVRIAVPQNEMQNYNEYVLGAVKEIYSYFPTYMRAAIGFCSYLLPQHAANYPYFGIIFLPQAEADAKTILLDGNSHSAYEIIPHTTGLKSLDRMIEHILKLDDPSQRKQYLYSVYLATEAKAKYKGFSPIAYSPMGDYLQVLEAEGSVQELIPLWISFSENKQKYPINVSQELDHHINENLTPKELQTYIEQTLPEKPALEELIRLEVSLLQLCSEREDCLQSVWKDVQTRLQKNEYRPEAVYNMLLAEENALAALMGREAVQQELAKWAHKISLDCLNREVQEMRQLVYKVSNLKQLSAELEKRVETFPNTIKTYADGTLRKEINDAIQTEADKLMQERVNNALQQLMNSSFQSQNEIEQALYTINQLISVLPRSESSSLIREELQTLQSKLQSQKFSSQTISRDLTRSICLEKNYFVALSMAAENVSRLSLEDMASIKAHLQKCRPLTRDAYLLAFKNYTGNDFTATTIRNKSEFFKDTVFEDLASFYSQPQEITLANKDTSDLLRQIHALEHEAELLGVKSALRIRLNKNCIEDAEVIEQVCALRCWSKSLTASKFTEISKFLLQNGIYRKEQLPALLDLAVSLNVDLKQFTRAVFEGCVRDMDIGDYRQFADTLREAVVKSGIVRSSEANGWICTVSEKARLNAEATKVIRELRRKEEEKHRRKKLRILFGAIAAVLVVVIGTVLTLWKLHVLSPDKPDKLISVENTIQDAFLAGAQTGKFDLSQLGLSSSARHDVATATYDDLEYVARYYKGSVNFPEEAETVSALPLSLEDLERLQLGYLNTLNLSGNHELTSLSALSGLKGIQKLILDDCRGLQPQAFRELRGISALSYLSLRDIPNITQELISEIVNNNNPGCLVRWTEDGQEMCCLDGKCLKLDDIEWTLSKISGLSRLQPLLTELQGLRCLKLPGAELTTEDLTVIWELQGLEYLDLSGACIREKQLLELVEQENLKELHNLCVLVLRDNPDLGDSAVERLKAYLPAGCYIDRTGSAGLSSEMLILAGESFPSDTTELDLHGRCLSKDELDAISQMSHLLTLNLANTGITELPDMSALTELMVLDASENDLAGAELSTLQQLAGLQELRLAGCRLESIPDLHKLGRLSRVDLSRNQFTFEGLYVGSDNGYRLRLPDESLRTVILADCGIDKLPSILPTQLERLDLSGNSLDNADLSVLKNLVSLKELSLSQCKLRSQCDLSTLAALLRLDLSGNHFEKLSVSETLPFTTLKGLSIAHNGAETIDLTELSLLENLSWLNLTGVENAVQVVWGDEQSSPIDDVIGFALDSIPNLQVLIVENREGINLDQYNYSGYLIISNDHEVADASEIGLFDDMLL